MLSIVGKISGIPWLYKPIINARQFTNEDFMMSETLGLVKTLGWKVVDGIILTIQVLVYIISTNRESIVNKVEFA